MALKVLDPSSIGKLRLLNFALAFALVGMVALIISRAAVPAGFIGSYEQSVVDKVNTARANKGLVRLQHIECLNTVAENWARQMAREGRMYHNPDGGADITAACGGAWASRGENVAAVYSTPDSVFKAWMASQGHYDNIAGKYAYKWTKTGVGAYRDANGKMWWTQVFARCGTCTTAWSRAAVLPDDNLATYYNTSLYNRSIGVTAANVTNFNYQFHTINNGDLFTLKRNGTSSGMVEVNSLTAASGHKTWTGAKATSIPLTDLVKYDAQLQIVPNGDLNIIRRKNTASGMVEVGRLTAESGYKTWAFDKPTIIPVADLVTYGAQLQVADAGDLFYIRTKATTGSVVQVYRLAVLADYKTWTYQKSTSVPIADVTKYNYKIQVMGNADLFFIRRQNTASGTIEAGRLTDASGLKSWAYMKQSAVALTFASSYVKEISAAQDGDLFLLKVLPDPTGAQVQRIGPGL